MGNMCGIYTNLIIQSLSPLCDISPTYLLVKTFKSTDKERFELNQT